MQAYWELINRRTELEAPDPLPDTNDAIRFAREIAQASIAELGEQVEELWLYGSRARGDQHPDSDLDLLAVIPDTEDKESSQAWDRLFRDLERKHGIEINLIHASSDQTETWDTRFYRNFRRDRIRII